MKPVERTSRLIKAIILLILSVRLNLTGYIYSGGKATPAAIFFVCMGLVALLVGDIMGFETFFNKKMERE